MNLLDRLVAIWTKEQPGEALPNPKKGMERRSFLKILGGSAAVAAAVPLLDLESLIWMPRTTILAPDVAELGSVFLTAEWVANEALKILNKNYGLMTAFNRDYSGLTLNGSFALPVGQEMIVKHARADVVQPIVTFMTNAVNPKIVEGATAVRGARSGRLVARAEGREGLVVEATKETFKGFASLRIDVRREGSM